MAVGQNSDSKSKKPVEEGVEPSCREDADGGPCGRIQLRNSDGPSTGRRDIAKDACRMVKSYKPRQNRDKDNKSESFSDIDDAEVFGYLNTKEEIHLKRILWEAMNGKCTKAKKQKRTTETKKGVSVKKAAKTSDRLECERRSSKINYDALKILNDELEQSSETAQVIGADSYARRTENSPHANISHRRGDNETFGHHEYGQEHLIDDYLDF